MNQDRRRARAIAIAASEKNSQQQWMRLGMITGLVMLTVGVLFQVIG